MRLVSAALRAVIGVLLAILALPWCFHLLVVQLRLAHGAPWHPWALSAGLLLAAGLVWCVALRVRITAFQATDGRGGAVLHQKVDPVRTTIIALAPYTLPLLLAPLLLVRQFLVTVPSTGGAIATFLVGFLTVHHLHGLYHNVRINFWGRQADLTRAGKILSLVVILGIHCLLAAWWVAVLW